MLSRFLSLLLSLSLLAVLAMGTECNASQMGFVSQFSLGKQDEFNRSFAKVQRNLGVLRGAQVLNNSYQYSIINITAAFYYRDSHQKATFRGQDVIFIDGGYAEVDLTFSWSKALKGSLSDVVSGTGSASGLSTELMLAKKLVIDNNAYSYELLEAMPFAMPEESAFELTRTDPPVSSGDKEVFLKLLNSMEGHADVVSELHSEVQKVFSDAIRSSLHDENFPLNLTFSYTWRPKTHRPNVTVSFVRRPTSVDVEDIGLISTFDVRVQGDDAWTCGTRKVPEMPHETR
jgi:hypothetical protein